MKGKTLLGLVSLIGMALGGIGTLLSTWADHREIDALIDEKLDERLANREENEDDEES